MNITLFDLFNNNSKRTLEKLSNAKMKDPKAVYTIVKITKLLEKEGRNISDTTEKVLENWSEYEGLRKELEEIKDLNVEENAKRYGEINGTISNYINSELERFTKETNIELNLSKIKIESLIDVDLTNNEIASVEWLVDFGGEE